MLWRIEPCQQQEGSFRIVALKSSCHNGARNDPIQPGGWSGCTYTSHYLHSRCLGRLAIHSSVSLVAEEHTWIPCHVSWLHSWEGMQSEIISKSFCMTVAATCQSRLTWCDAETLRHTSLGCFFFISASLVGLQICFHLLEKLSEKREPWSQLQ